MSFTSEMTVDSRSVDSEGGSLPWLCSQETPAESNTCWSVRGTSAVYFSLMNVKRPMTLFGTFVALDIVYMCQKGKPDGRACCERQRRRWTQGSAAACLSSPVRKFSPSMQPG